MDKKQSLDAIDAALAALGDAARSFVAATADFNNAADDVRQLIEAGEILPMPDPAVLETAIKGLGSLIVAACQRLM